ncbi:hypothetical protein BI308_25915 [Roseofilum reptotaenium AO1-A]|uniref:Uncharacterized protein n=1 Tax=Roseofilum reptotaenium AO1-A TaxID=1925591 RepID=A0A1L9QCD3_9CYAN|nr:hypothetical protein BI308_25915 [Roseofilum reptotaenium AO1-A]
MVGYAQGLSTLVGDYLKESGHCFAWTLFIYIVTYSSDLILSFLGDFVQISKTKYQGQVAVDLKYLQASEPFFQEMIATIRGRLEIEQIEADRKRNQQESISSRDFKYYYWSG